MSIFQHERNNGGFKKLLEKSPEMVFHRRHSNTGVKRKSNIPPAFVHTEFHKNREHRKLIPTAERRFPPLQKERKFFFKFHVIPAARNVSAQFHFYHSYVPILAAKMSDLERHFNILFATLLHLFPSPLQSPRVFRKLVCRRHLTKLRYDRIV